MSTRRMAPGSLMTATRPTDNPPMTMGCSKWADVHASSGLFARTRSS